MKKLLILALLFWGCEKDTPTESSVHPLVGVWKLVEFTNLGDIPFPTEVSGWESYFEIYTFNSDGTYMIHENNYTNATATGTGIWATSEPNTLTITILTDENSSLNSETITYSFSDNHLILSYHTRKWELKCEKQ